MIVADTSVVYALLDEADSWHERVVAWYHSVATRFAITPLVVAEVDHLAPRAGERARDAWRRDLRAGAYEVMWWGHAEETAVDVAEAYRDLGVDLTDASLVALSERLQTTDIATLDERHFRSMRPLSGSDAFRLLPMDA